MSTRENTRDPISEPGSVESPPGGGFSSRARRITYRVIAVVVALWLLLFNVFGLMEVVLMWLPAETVAELVDDPEGDLADLVIHRSHFMAIGIVSWATMLSVFAQLTKPARRVGSLLLLTVIALGATVVYAFSGTLGEWIFEEGLVLGPVLLLIAVHPASREILRRPSFDAAMAGAAAVAGVPWLAYVVDNSRMQLANVAGDTHAAAEHWATAALMGIAIVAAALIGASDHRGWRLPAWIAAGASVLFGAHALTYPGLASGLSGFWAVTAIGWGVVFAISVIRRSRQADADSTRTANTGRG